MYHRDIIYYCPQRPPLYYSIEFQCGSLTAPLLSALGDVDLINCGVAPLHVASKCGATKAVRTLLDLGATVDIRSSKDRKGITSMLTPLHFAAEGGHPEVAKLLLDAGADPHCQNESGSTPFSRAARSGSLETMKVLYDAGSNINTQKAGVTPLFEALAQCRPRVACQLLHWGADPTILTERNVYHNDNAVKLLQRNCNAKRTKIASSKDSGRSPEGGRNNYCPSWVTEADMYEQIFAIRAQRKGPEAFEHLMKGLRREQFLMKQMEKDTRPGSERDKDYRYPTDPTKIITSSEFCDRPDEPYYSRNFDLDWLIMPPQSVQ